MLVRKEVDITLLVLFLIMVLSFSFYLEGQLQEGKVPAVVGSAIKIVLPAPIKEIVEPIQNVSLSPTFIEHIISINNTKFNPAEISISAGDTVSWKNDDPRRVYRIYEQSVDSRFNPFLDVGETFSFAFNATGTYQIRDATFKHMKGTIIVE